MKQIFTLMLLALSIHTFAQAQVDKNKLWELSKKNDGKTHWDTLGKCKECLDVTLSGTFDSTYYKYREGINKKDDCDLAFNFLLDDTSQAKIDSITKRYSLNSLKHPHIIHAEIVCSDSSKADPSCNVCKNVADSNFINFHFTKNQTISVSGRLIIDSGSVKDTTRPQFELHPVYSIKKFGNDTKSNGEGNQSVSNISNEEIAKIEAKLKYLDSILNPSSSNSLSNVFPQPKKPTDTAFVTKYNMYLHRCDLDGSQTKYTAPRDKVMVESGIKFYKEYVVKDINNKITGYVVYISDWAKYRRFAYNKSQNLKYHTYTNPKKMKKHKYKKSKGMDGKRKTILDAELEPWFYFLPVADLNLIDTFVPVHKPFTFTTLNIQSLPAKFRFGSNQTLHYPDDNLPYNRRFDVAGGINVGSAFGIKCGLDKKGNNNLSFLVGFNVGSVSIDSASTDNKSGTTKLTTGLTPYGGILYEYSQFQAGFFVGFDFLTGTVGRNWIYRNQPWFGIGLGFSLFKPVTVPSGQN